MVAIFYIIFLVLSIIFLKQVLGFLTYFYKNPLQSNTYGDFIPSKKLNEEKNMIENKDGSFSAIIELEGFAYFKEEDIGKAEEQSFEIKNRAFNFNDLKEDVQIKFIFKRYKVKDGYNNRNFIEITANTSHTIVNNINRLLSGLFEFKPVHLVEDKLLNFIFFNCNLVEKPINLANANILADVCSYSQIQFYDMCGQLSNADISKYFKCFSFSFGSAIDSKYFATLITSNLEFDFVFNTKFFSKIKAQGILQEDKRNINSSNDASGDAGLLASFFSASNKKIAQLQEAQEIFDNEEANLCVGDVFLIIYADSVNELYDSAKLLKDMVSKFEIFLTEELKLLNFFFLQRLIGFKLHYTMKFLLPYLDTLIYAKKILSSTLVGLFDYIKMPSGLSKCDWGDAPICLLTTNYNNNYNFYLHVSEEKTAIGHGVIIAPSGGGKTTFLQYIMMGIIKNYKDVDVYSFDRFNGISVFSAWIGGVDVNFLELAINPLQVDLDLEENRDFLYNFLAMIAKPTSSQDYETLGAFVDTIALLPPQKRILSELFENNAIPPCVLKDNLEKWAVGNYAKYINAQQDKFELTSHMLNFQMDKILDDEELSAPIIYYIMFKIRQKAKATSRGHFIFIDESAKMLKNSFFTSQIEVLLQEHRKLRGCVWLAFQNPNAFLGDKKLKELILNQCQNQVLFSSDAINKDILEAMNINIATYLGLNDAIKSTQNKYFVLLKRPQENVILNVNLKNKLGDNLKFLSSSIEDVNKMKALTQEFGELWYEHF